LAATLEIIATTNSLPQKNYSVLGLTRKEQNVNCCCSPMYIWVVRQRAVCNTVNWNVQLYCGRLFNDMLTLQLQRAVRRERNCFSTMTVELQR